MRVPYLSALVISLVLLQVFQISEGKFWKKSGKVKVCSKWLKNDATANHECDKRCATKWGRPRSDPTQAPFARGQCFGKKCLCSVSPYFKSFLGGFKDKARQKCVVDRYCKKIFLKLQKKFNDNPGLSVIVQHH